MPNPNQPFESDQLIGSREKSKSGFGQNGDDSASSLTPGQTKPPIANVSPPQPSAALIASRGGDWQTRDLSVKNSEKEFLVPVHREMGKRGVSDGSPGGTVPKSLSYPKK